MTEQNNTEISELLQKANTGDAQAQFELALRYAKGTNVEKNTELALDWHTKAAEQGQEGAQFAQGFLYLVSNPVVNKQVKAYINKDLIEKLSGKNDPLWTMLFQFTSLFKEHSESTDDLAFLWLNKAAEQNHTDANFWLGLCYLNAIGTEENIPLALACFKKAAEKGSTEACYYLALSYRDARGAEQDYERAFLWITKAVEDESIDPEAYLFLGDLYGNGHGIQKNYELALKWYKKASKKNVTGAQRRINFCNEFGLGIEKNIDLLSEWHKKPTEPEVNDVNYQYWVAKKYLYGEGVEKDITKGMKCMVGAAFQGHIEANKWIEKAYLYLAFPPCALENENAEKCYKIAFDYCTKNLDGHKRVEAYLFLGVLYSSGRGVAQNDELAFECFKKAADICKDYGDDADDNWEIDYFVALFLSNCYVQGKGTERNLDKASHCELNSLDGIGDVFIEGVSALSRHSLTNNTIFLTLLRCEIFIECHEYDLAKGFITQLFENNWQSMDKGFEEMCLINIDKEKELAKKNQELEAKNQELNNMIAMFAHNFLGTLQCIRSNAEHENNPDIHLKTVKMMGGALTAFSILSADDDKLIEQLKQDKSGEANLQESLANNLALAISQLLSKTNKDKIINLYLKHLRQTRQIEQKTTGEELRLNKAYRKKWQALQHQWEDEFNALFSEQVELPTLQAWIADNFFPIQITGFHEHDIRFKEYGITDSIFLVIFMEIFVNALKYMDVAGNKPLTITLYKQDQCYQLLCENPGSLDTGKGTHKGIDFLNTIATKLNGSFNSEFTENSFKTAFIIPSELLK